MGVEWVNDKRKWPVLKSSQDVEREARAGVEHATAQTATGSAAQSREVEEEDK